MSKARESDAIRELHAHCRVSFNGKTSTPMTFMLRPRTDTSQDIFVDEFIVQPDVVVESARDLFGNRCQRLIAPAGEFSVQTNVRARVRATDRAGLDAGYVSVPELPADILSYLLPSRYCESDRFADMAADIVANQPMGFVQVRTICEWVRDNIRNIPLSSTYPVSAIEVNQRGEGVCRDLAHMGITLCRALCIPARMVVGYLEGLEPMDVHAWFEAYVGDQWWTFDPAVPAATDYRIVIARGRDAADVAIYNQYGPLLLPNDIVVSVVGKPLSASLDEH